MSKNQVYMDSIKSEKSVSYVMQKVVVHTSTELSVSESMSHASWCYSSGKTLCLSSVPSG